MGAPVLRSASHAAQENGDLRIMVKLKIPQNISKKHKELLEKLREFEK
jgi:DnaJ-class molecular chaperone